MKNLKSITNPNVNLVFQNYPTAFQNKMLQLIEMVIETANEIEGLVILRETLKWSEPSYLTKFGITLRMDWKPKMPDQFAMYFKCTSRLVETFKIIFNNEFEYEGNRAIVFKLEEKIPKEKLKKYIEATLTYHLVKKLPTLGM